MSKSFERVKPYLEQATALSAARNLFEWDDETLAPAAAGMYTSEVIGVLSGQYLEIMTGDNLEKGLRQCKRDKNLSEVEQAVVREAQEIQQELNSIPPVEYREFAKLSADGARIWAAAKKKKDFSAFAPTLFAILDYQKRFASYRAKRGQKLYDVMLASYEKSFDQKSLDRFFANLKDQLIPLMQKVSRACESVDDSFLTGRFSQGTQERAARYLAQYLGFDFDRGVMAVSAHPFTTNLHNHDVRLTTHYTNRMESSIFSVIHEVGHGLYEQGIRDDLTLTLAGQGASMAMHESQSRFFENIIGRSKAFWVPVYPKLQEIFKGKLQSVPLDSFVLAVNKVEPGLIRTEADELTYSLHILIRYEMEKMIVDQEVAVEDLPKLWNDKYEEYLGRRPKNDSEGILQDIHWSQGSIGYFPSYALGSAFAAQIYHHMRKIMDLDGLLESGKISVIREYLRDNIHQFGKCKSSRQILMDVTGEDFNPDYYMEYLKEKYQALYL